MRGDASQQERSESDLEFLSLPSHNDIVRHRRTGCLGVAYAFGWDEDGIHARDALPSTHLCVSWLGDGYADEDDAVALEEVELHARLFCTADGVLLASPGPGPSMIGTVEEISTTVDLSLTKNRVLADIPIALLKQCYPHEGRLVVSKDLSSAGRIDAVCTDLLLRFPNGDKYWVMELPSFEAVEVIHEEGVTPPQISTTEYYPGAKVKVDRVLRASLIPEALYGKALRPPKQLQRRLRRLPEDAVVERVGVRQAAVRWDAGKRMAFNEIDDSGYPNALEKIEDLFVVERHFMVQLGEAFCVRPGMEAESLQYLRQPSQPHRSGAELAAVDDLPMAGIITDIKTTCAVRWQDNSVSTHCSTELIPDRFAGQKDFWPGNFVEHAFEERKDVSYGVIQSVDVEEQMCTVIWVDLLNADTPEQARVSAPEELSTFELNIHPQFVDMEIHCMCSLGVPEMEGAKIGELAHISPEGFLTLAFEDGTSAVGLASNVFALPDVDINFHGAHHMHDGPDEEYWDDSAAQEVEESTVLGEATHYWGAALDASVAAAGDQVARSTSIATGRQDSPLSEAQSQSNTTETLSHSHTPGGPKEVLPEPKDDSLADVRVADRSEDSSFSTSEQLPPAHPFAGTPASANMRVVQKEWRILQRSLPPGIQVRAFEDRMDIMQVLIFGAKGTPYHLAPFVFNIHLPATYPTVPPAVQFQSVLSSRLNPNLYENGRVCLSLLGTWEGDDCESWSPSSSTVLQVIVSIQGLILGTSEPFFLEPGYDRFRSSPEGTEKSLDYNQTALILSLKHISSMYHHCRSPAYSGRIDTVLQKEIVGHLLAVKDVLKGKCEKYLQLYAGKRATALTADSPPFGVPFRHSPGFTRMMRSLLLDWEQEFASG